MSRSRKRLYSSISSAMLESISDFGSLSPISSSWRKPESSPPSIIDDMIKCLDCSNIADGIIQFKSLLKNEGKLNSLFLTSELVLNTFNVDVYWMLHLNGILNFSCYLQHVDEERMFRYLKDIYNSSDDDLFFSMFGDIVLFLLQSTVNVDSDADIINSTKCADIIEHLCFNSAFNDFYNSSKVFEQLYIKEESMRMISDIFLVIRYIENESLLVEWQMRILTKILFGLVELHVDKLLTSEKEVESLWDTYLKLLQPDVLLTVLDRCVRGELDRDSDSRSPLDIKTMHFNQFAASPSFFSPLFAIVQTTNSSITPCDDNNSNNNNSRNNPQTYSHSQSGRLTVRQLTQLADRASQISVSEGNPIPLLRSTYLLEIALTMTSFEHWFENSLFNFDTNTQSQHELKNSTTTTDNKHNVDSYPPSMTDENVTIVKSIQDLNFIILTLCELVGYHSISALRITTRVVRGKRPLCKEAVDTYLQCARSRLRVLETQYSISADNQYLNNNIQNKSQMDLSLQTLTNWANVLEKTGLLPGGVRTFCTLAGKDGYQSLFQSMLTLIDNIANTTSSTNPINEKSIRRLCTSVVKAMSSSVPPLCSYTDAEKMIRSINKSEQIDGKCNSYSSILLEMKLPKAVRLGAEKALTVLVLVQNKAKSGGFFSSEEDIKTQTSNWCCYCRDVFETLNQLAVTAAASQTMTGKPQHLGVTDSCSPEDIYTLKLQLASLLVTAVLQTADIIHANFANMLQQYHNSDRGTSNHIEKVQPLQSLSGLCLLWAKGTMRALDVNLGTKETAEPARAATGVGVNNVLGGSFVACVLSAVDSTCNTKSCDASTNSSVVEVVNNRCINSEALPLGAAGLLLAGSTSQTITYIVSTLIQIPTHLHLQSAGNTKLRTPPTTTITTTTTTSSYMKISALLRAAISWAQCSPVNTPINSNSNPTNNIHIILSLALKCFEVISECTNYLDSNSGKIKSPITRTAFDSKLTTGFDFGSIRQQSYLNSLDNNNNNNNNNNNCNLKEETNVIKKMIMILSHQQQYLELICEWLLASVTCYLPEASHSEFTSDNSSSSSNNNNNYNTIFKELWLVLLDFNYNLIESDVNKSIDSKKIPLSQMIDISTPEVEEEEEEGGRGGGGGGSTSSVPLESSLDIYDDLREAACRFLRRGLTEKPEAESLLRCLLRGMLAVLPPEGLRKASSIWLKDFFGLMTSDTSTIIDVTKSSTSNSRLLDREKKMLIHILIDYLST